MLIVLDDSEVSMLMSLCERASEFIPREAGQHYLGSSAHPADGYVPGCP